MGIDPYVLRTEVRLRARAGTLDPTDPTDPTGPTDPAGLRRHAAEQQQVFVSELGIVPAAVATADHRVPVDGYPDTRVRIYHPTGCPTAPDARLPVLLYFYGGAFMMGSIDWPGYDAYCRRLAADSGVIVVAGEYALAPEVTFPAQPEQCWTMLDWVAGHAHEFGGDPERLAIGGASAGANLAAVAAILNLARNRHPVRLQVLMNMCADLTGGHLVELGELSPIPDPVLQRNLRFAARTYLGGADPALPTASPLFADLRGLPESLVITCEIDPLRDDGEAFAAALQDADVPTTCVRFVGQTHTSGGLLGAVPAADAMHRLVTGTVRTTLNDSAAPVVPSGA